MKKLVFALFAFLLVGTLSAQDHEKAYKKAKRLLGTYNLDPSNKEKLVEAQEKIDHAMTGDLSGIKNPHDAYQVQGDIYNEIANTQVSATQMKKEGGALAAKAQEGVVEFDNPALVAAAAYKKALELGSKSSHKKKAAEGLLYAQNNLTNEGIFKYGEEDYEKAFMNFAEVTKIHKVLKANDSESSLDKDGAYDNQLYLVGLAGINAGKPAEAKPYFEELYNKDFDEPIVYSSLYLIESEKDADAAYKYLEKGRKKYPNDSGLLFSEINHFLKAGRLDELIGRLNKAIEVEKDNVSLYTTLGNVYDNLYQKEVEAGGEKEKEYFDKAFANYQIAVEKDPKNVDAHYSLGALYYNKAALVTQSMLKLQDDYSKEGMKKYNDLKKDSDDLFKQALPHFKKAESLNPNDLNTLIALKEIYARTDDLEKSNAFKARMETVQGGGKNDTSYFNE